MNKINFLLTLFIVWSPFQAASLCSGFPLWPQLDLQGSECLPLCSNLFHPITPVLPCCNVPQNLQSWVSEELAAWSSSAALLTTEGNQEERCKQVEAAPLANHSTASTPCHSPLLVLLLPDWINHLNVDVMQADEA